MTLFPSGAPEASVLAALAATRWDAVTHYARTTSTNDVACDHVRTSGNPHVVVTAAEQTAGRGRLGRRWVHTSASGTTPLSLAVTATLPAPPHATLVPFAAGLAGYDALIACQVAPAVKWPNDLLLAGVKTAGILVERVHVAGHDLVVIGTGFNLDWRDVPCDGATPWTSIAEHRHDTVDENLLLATYLVALHRWLDTLTTPQETAALLHVYRERCATLGTPVTVTLANNRVVHGVAEAITDDGELLVRQDGTLVTVTSGDVWHNLAGA